MVRELILAIQLYEHRLFGLGIKVGYLGAKVLFDISG
jgi:hypothetical protein